MKRATVLILSVFILMGLALPALAQSVPEAVYQPPKGPPEGRPVCGPPPHPIPCRPADVPPVHWAINGILTLYDLGLLQGDPDGSFRPNATMSNGEAVTLFLRLLGITAPAAEPGEHWAAPALEQAVASGLIPADATDPTQPMSRLTVALMLARALGIQPVVGTPAWSDVSGLSAGDVALLNGLYQAGLFRGFPDGTFRPGEPLTRAQVAILVARVLAAGQ